LKPVNTANNNKGLTKLYFPLIMFNRRLAEFLVLFGLKRLLYKARFEVFKNFLIFNFWVLSVNVN